MSSKAAGITLDDFYAQFVQMQKSFSKRFDNLDRELNGIGIVVDGLSTVVYALAKDQRVLREYTEAGFDTMNDRFDYVDNRFDRMDDRFDRIDDRFDRVEERLDRIEPSPGSGFYEH